MIGLTSCWSHYHFMVSVAFHYRVRTEIIEQLHCYIKMALCFCNVRWICFKPYIVCFKIYAVFLVQMTLSRCCGIAKEKLEHTWRGSSAALDRPWAVFCGCLGADWSGFVIVGGWGGKVSPAPKWMVLCRTDTCRALPPAPEVINMHLQPPSPSSWHSSVLLAPVIHHPFCTTYNSRLCLLSGKHGMITGQC